MFDRSRAMLRSAQSGQLARIQVAADTDVGRLAGEAAIAEVDHEAQGLGVRLDDGIVVRAVEVLDVGAEADVPGLALAVEGAKDAAFQAGEAELVAGGGVELRLLAGDLEVVLVILD